jgi:hypothetical protein
MTTELREGPLEPASEPSAAPAKPAARKLTWREERWRRRRRRRFFEEILGWILVPIIIFAGYWAVVGGLNAAGTSPFALIAGVRQLMTGGGGQP